MATSTVIDDCLSAFKNESYDETVKLIPLLMEQAKKHILIPSLENTLYKYTVECAVAETAELGASLGAEYYCNAMQTELSESRSTFFVGTALSKIKVTSAMVVGTDLSDYYDRPTSTSVKEKELSQQQIELSDYTSSDKGTAELSDYTSIMITTLPKYTYIAELSDDTSSIVVGTKLSVKCSIAAVGTKLPVSDNTELSDKSYNVVGIELSENNFGVTGSDVLSDDNSIVMETELFDYTYVGGTTLSDDNNSKFVGTELIKCTSTVVGTELNSAVVYNVASTHTQKKLCTDNLIPLSSVMGTKLSANYTSTALPDYSSTFVGTELSKCASIVAGTAHDYTLETESSKLFCCIVIGDALSKFVEIAQSKCHGIVAGIELPDYISIFVGAVLSDYTICTSSIDPLNEYELKADFLQLSSRNGWLWITKKLIEVYHFDPIKGDNIGNTSLHYAAAGNHLEVMKYLICKNRELRTRYKEKLLHNRNDYEASPLCIAAANESLDVMKYLLEQHYSTDETDRVGRAILHYGAKHIKIVKYLITECKCDPFFTDKDGKTVLHYAIKENCFDVVEYLLSIKQDDGNTFLHFVARTGPTDLVKHIVSNYNSDPKASNQRGQTILHFGAKDINTLKFLITECKCDPMITDKCGETVLHYAVDMNDLDVIEYLLSTGKCDPVAKDNLGRTALQLTSYHNQQKVRSLFKKFGQVKTSHPVDSYVNVLLLGNPRAGKSTLSQVIIETTGFVAFRSFRNVKGVEPLTAGIIPYKLQHKALGNIILHDFAGHSEYYTSHSAVIENLLQGSSGVFLIVVNIIEEEVVKQLHQWLTVVRNEKQKALDQCHVIVVVSHVDEISDSYDRRKRKEEMQQIIGSEKCVFLDCRKLGGSGVGSFFHELSSVCKSIRIASGRSLSLYCHMMYGLLEGRREDVLTLSDVMTAAKNNNSYVLPDEKEEALEVLLSLDKIGLIKVLIKGDNVWVVVSKGILLSKVNGILFAPKIFKEYVNIASNTGIVSVSGLTRLFPDYDLDMLICFLNNMELCQEMNPSFIEKTNLIDKNQEEERERLLFFPCLLRNDRPDDEMTSKVYQFGWCLQCTGEHHFFPPRYFHILSLHLAYELAQPKENNKLSRRCTFWKNGLYWSNSSGVGVLVEIVDESQCALVLMSYQIGCMDSMVELRRKVIGEVMKVYKESCPSLEVKELVIDSKELDYPVCAPIKRTVHSVKDLISSIMEGNPFIVSDTGTELKNVKSILPDESLVDIKKLSLLGGRNIEV